MATYVLVHGGGHGGRCYQRVARLLRAEGHEVYAPTLHGRGASGRAAVGRDTGHHLMITEPAFVADALAKISDAPRGGPA